LKRLARDVFAAVRQTACEILDETALAKLAANCGDVNIARFRYRTQVPISRVPPVSDLTCERIVDHERVRDLVKHRLKELAVFFLGLEEMCPWAIRVVLVKQLVTCQFAG
jgi:hypothetical protein